MTRWWRKIFFFFFEISNISPSQLVYFIILSFLFLIFTLITLIIISILNWVVLFKLFVFQKKKKNLIKIFPPQTPQQSGFKNHEYDQMKSVVRKKLYWYLVIEKAGKTPDPLSLKIWLLHIEQKWRKRDTHA